MASTFRSHAAKTSHFRMPSTVTNLSETRQYHSESAIHTNTPRAPCFSMRAASHHSESRIGILGSFRQAFQLPQKDTLAIIEKRKKTVTRYNQCIAGGNYNPKALTLNSYQSGIATIRTNAKRATPHEVLDHLCQAMGTLERQACDKDWGATKAILDSCSAQTLSEAINQATTREIVNLYTQIFFSLVKAADAPELPTRYKLSHQIMKTNHANWNEGTIGLVKKLIDALDDKSVAALNTKSTTTPSRYTPLEIIIKQAEYYSGTVEMPQPNDDDSTWISYDEQLSLSYYLESKLQTLSSKES